MKAQKGFSIVEGLIILVVVCALGFGGWYVWDQQQGDDDSNNNSQTIQQGNGNEAANLTSFTYESTVDDNSITVTHPSSWETKAGGSQAGSANGAYIKSEQGNYLHLWDPEGLGGDCFGLNDDQYTLTQKIPTATEGVFFTEYTAPNTGQTIDILSVEDYNRPIYSTATAHRDLEVGETNTDTCTNPVFDYTTAGGIYVTINTEAEPNLPSTVEYSDLMSDQAFIDMLRSLTVVDN